MKFKIIFIIIVLIFIIFCRIIFSYYFRINTEKSQTQKRVPVVKVQKVRSENIIREFSAPARVSSKYRVDVLARIDGYLVKSYFKEGDYVQEGQILFEIEPYEYIFALNKARADLELSKAKLMYAEKQLLRYKELTKNDYIAKSEYDAALAERDALKSQVDGCQNILKDAQRNLSYTKIKAPVKGRIGSIYVTVGNYVAMNSGALTTINSYEPMYILFPLEKSDYDDLIRIDKNINKNREVEFVFSSGRVYQFKGIQNFLDNKIDETTGTITLRATFPNPNRELLPGDFGKVIIYSNLKDSIPVIPVSSIMQNQEGKYVYMLDKDNIPRISYIKILDLGNDKCGILSGVKTGDVIITSGLQKVLPGTPIFIENENNQNNEGFQSVR